MKQSARAREKLKQISLVFREFQSSRLGFCSVKLSGNLAHRCNMVGRISEIRIPRLLGEMGRGCGLGDDYLAW